MWIGFQLNQLAAELIENLRCLNQKILQDLFIHDCIPRIVALRDGLEA